MTFTNQDAAYVARRLEELPCVQVDLRDYNNALRATFRYGGMRFVVHWGLEPTDDAPDMDIFLSQQSFIDFVAAELLSRAYRALSAPVRVHV